MNKLYEHNEFLLKLERLEMEERMKTIAQNGNDREHHKEVGMVSKYDKKEELIERHSKNRTMEKFRSSKVFDGFSTVFRQHKAIDTHCSKLHGYGISFKVTFEGELDHRNWVWDFGGMKRAKTLIDGMQPKVWIDYMFDHTVIMAADDPALERFTYLADDGIVQLRIIGATGAEKFAQFIYTKLNAFVKEETNNRVRVTEVEFREHQKNSATYGE